MNCLLYEALPYCKVFKQLITGKSLGEDHGKTIFTDRQCGTGVDRQGALSGVDNMKTPTCGHTNPWPSTGHIYHHPLYIWVGERYLDHRFSVSGTNYRQNLGRSRSDHLSVAALLMEGFQLLSFYNIRTFPYVFSFFWVVSYGYINNWKNNVKSL